MTIKERLSDPFQIIISLLAAAGVVWGIAVSFTGLQTKAEAKETLAPVVADTKKLRTDFQDFQVKVSTDIGQLQTKTDGIDQKMNTMLGLQHETRHLERARVAPVVRKAAAAKRKAARKVLAEAPANDPLAGLDGI